MKRIILPIAALAFLTSSYAQDSKIFAVTGDTRGNTNWNAVREINGTDGSIKATIYAPSTKQSVLYLSAVGKSLSPNIQPVEPTFSGVAASAYDALHHRLYFTNMRGNELRYFDLNQQTTTVVTNDDLNFNTGNKYTSEAAIITRMAFGLDGNGYALTNDGEHLVRFTTDQKPTITDLGKLIDGSANGNTSVHSQCSSWGGDMVGDAFGNLYLVTMRGFVFKINPATRIADLVGQIKGLPADFTTNGAAVNQDGDLIVSSAVFTESYFKVNINTLQVIAPVKTENGVYNASDLASANLLYQKSTTVAAKLDAAVIGNYKVSMYPNPVTAKTFQVKFDNLEAGNYTIQLSDASGRVTTQNVASIAGKGQVSRVVLPSGTSNGIYLVKIISEDKKVVYSDKISVQ